MSLQVLAGTTNDSLAEPHDHWNTTTPLGCTPVGGMEVGKQAAAWLRDDATLFLRSLQKKALFPAESGGLVKKTGDCGRARDRAKGGSEPSPKSVVSHVNKFAA